MKHRYSRSANERAAIVYHNQWAQVCVLDVVGYKNRWGGEGPVTGETVICFLRTVLAGSSKKRPAVLVAWHDNLSVAGKTPRPPLSRGHGNNNHGWIEHNPRIFLDDTDIGRLSGAKVKIKIISNIVSYAVLNKISGDLDVPLSMKFPLPKELADRAAFVREGILERQMNKLERVTI